MKPEAQEEINERLKRAAKLIDEAITPMCEAASIAILERQFAYAGNLIRKASVADNARAEAFTGTLDAKSNKQE